jgi:hypothetical protein
VSATSVRIICAKIRGPGPREQHRQNCLETLSAAFGKPTVGAGGHERRLGPVDIRPRKTAGLTFAMERGKMEDNTAAKANFSASANAFQRGPELLGQTVVVIGGSAGIGLETARRARAEGAKVVLTERRKNVAHGVSRG